MATGKCWMSDKMQIALCFEKAFICVSDKPKVFELSNGFIELKFVEFVDCFWLSSRLVLSCDSYELNVVSFSLLLSKILSSFLSILSNDLLPISP
jgi:hypothetical protein